MQPVTKLNNTAQAMSPTSPQLNMESATIINHPPKYAPTKRGSTTDISTCFSFLNLAFIFRVFKNPPDLEKVRVSGTIQEPDMIDCFLNLS